MKDRNRDSIRSFIDAYGGIPVSPIGGSEEVPFHFLCLGHLDLAEALGFRLEQITPVLTVVKEDQLTTEEELEALIAGGRFDFSVMEREVERLREGKRRCGEKELFGGGCFGPLTVVSDILGAERLLKYIVKCPEMVERFVAYVTEYMVELARREAEAGQDFFWIAEPLASLLSPRNFWRFSGQYLKKIYDRADAPGFLHVCGRTLKHTPYMVETGAEVLSIDSCTDLKACLEMVEENIIIMGNVNPSLLLLGSRAEVEEEVEQILSVGGRFPNFILSTGCSVMEGTPEENIQMLYKVCRRQMENRLEK